MAVNFYLPASFLGGKLPETLQLQRGTCMKSQMQMNVWEAHPEVTQKEWVNLVSRTASKCHSAVGT